jgi:hypothetical protein
MGKRSLLIVCAVQSDSRLPKQQAAETGLKPKPCSWDAPTVSIRRAMLSCNNLGEIACMLL